MVGEYGSAMHNVVFSTRQPVCLCLGHINLLQSTLCAMRGVRVAYFSTQILEKNAVVDVNAYSLFLAETLKYIN